LQNILEVAMTETLREALALDDKNAGLAFEPKLSVLMVVAHPDDETLWAGGLVLMTPGWRWRIISLCRGGDPDRRPKYFEVLARLGVVGSIGDLDDGPEQRPLEPGFVEAAVERELPGGEFDLVVTHSPLGEYTRHRRHEEVSRAVLALWESGALQAREVWLFAYSDEERSRLPRAIDEAPLKLPLPGAVFEKKRGIVRDVYGFAPDSWEFRTTPEEEAFWRLQTPMDAWRRFPKQIPDSTR
jgi:LmbE family N-acetylglucosaminyl deacetylase